MTAGRYLVEPHARWIYEGYKTAFLSSDNVQKYLDQEIYICGDFVYVLVEITRIVPLNLEEFKQTQEMHRVTEEERLRWWKDYDTLYMYIFDFVEWYYPPKRYKRPPGIQTWIKEVEILED